MATTPKPHQNEARGGDGRGECPGAYPDADTPQHEQQKIDRDLAHVIGVDGQRFPVGGSLPEKLFSLPAARPAGHGSARNRSHRRSYQRLRAGGRGVQMPAGEIGHDLILFPAGDLVWIGMRGDRRKLRTQDRFHLDAPPDLVESRVIDGQQDAPCIRRLDLQIADLRFGAVHPDIRDDAAREPCRPRKLPCRADRNP